MKAILLATGLTMALINIAFAQNVGGVYDAHCPNKEALKNALAEHLKEGKKATDFTFAADSVDGKQKNQKWEATGFINQENWNQVPDLSIGYEAYPKQEHTCRAHFFKPGLQKPEFTLVLEKTLQ